MPDTPTVAVTGATGAIGGRVARALADRGVRQRLVVRDPAKAPDLPGSEAVPGTYSDGEAMRRALDGIDTLLFVSGREAADRLQQHFTVVEAAAAAGVRHVVYTSYLAAAPDATFTLGRDHYATEQAIKGAGLTYTILRDSQYLDFVPFMVWEDDCIHGPAGDGRLAGVARADVADVAVVALTSDAHDDVTYDLTGPELLSFQDYADILSKHWGRPIRYHDETLEEARASRSVFGAPDWEVEGWVTSYAAVKTGEMEVVSDAVERVTGHAPTSLVDYLARHG